MNIDEIREDIKKHIGKEIKIKYNLGRNKYETYKVVITDVFNNIFVVRKDEVTKSFTYKDVITKIIKIDY